MTNNLSNRGYLHSICSLAFLIAVPNFALAQELGGFAEVRGQASAGVSAPVAAVAERVRPEFSAEIIKRLVFSATVEMLFVQGRDQTEELYKAFSRAGLEEIAKESGLAPRSYANDILRIDRVGDYMSVERLYIDAYLPWFDIRFGRQALNWGSSFVVNPTDPFPEVLLLEPWKLRSGVNALRATIPIKDMHQIQLVVGSDDAFLHPRIAARGTVNFFETDFSLVGAWREESRDGIVGLDIKGTLGVGFWLEGAVHISETGVYEELAIGIDYSFPVLDTLVTTLQYYRNGNGNPNGPASSPLPLGSDAGDTSNKFAPVFTGRDYGMLSVSLGIIPEVSTGVLWIQNFGDGTALFVPTITTFPTSFLEIAASAQIPASLWGGGGEFRRSTADLQPVIPDENGVPRTLDLTSISPVATFNLWARVNF